MYFEIDQRFRDYFQNLKQVFLYITDECNLRCVHCLYKPDLIFHLGEKEIELNTALALISDFKEIGASKLTIMGGEKFLKKSNGRCPADGWQEQNEKQIGSGAKIFLGCGTKGSFFAPLPFSLFQKRIYIFSCRIEIDRIKNLFYDSISIPKL